MALTLSAIAAAARSGRLPFALRIVTASGCLIGGRPGPAEMFDEAMSEAIRADIRAQADRLPEDQREPAFRSWSEAAELMMSGLREPSGDEPEDLVLLEAMMRPPSGATIRVPAVRVALDRIDAWWVGGGD